jgi:hypothetical protein
MKENLIVLWSHPSPVVTVEEAEEIARIKRQWNRYLWVGDAKAARA